MGYIASYPKDKIKILLLENIHSVAQERFKKRGYTNITCLTASPSEDDLIEALESVKLLGIRSNTTITDKVLQSCSQTMFAVGCFCIGTNQVDIDSANNKGIAVFNSPYSNTRSVAELVIGATIMLSRKMIDTSQKVHQGIWYKTSDGSHEIRGKSLGIIGYGNIGSQLSVMAEAMGMKVYYYDIIPRLPLGNAQPTKTLQEVLAVSDVVSLHVPATPSTHNLINKETLSYCKKGALLINYARGNVVQLDDLARALSQGLLVGAAIDVFPKEPNNNKEQFSSVLQGFPNVLLSPHIGGSTEEAQQHIATDVTDKLLNFLETGTSVGSKSIPEVEAVLVKPAHRILHIHHNKPGMISRISKILYENNINIKAQQLRSNADVGYAVLDVGTNFSKEAYALLKKVPNTIKTRLLY